MSNSIAPQIQFLYSQNPNLSFPPIWESIIFLQNPNFALKIPSFSLSHKIQIQKPILCAKKNRTRHGSRRLTRYILKYLPIVVSNLKILPPPLDLMLTEICTGDGRGVLNGVGGGGGRWWSRKTKNFVGFGVAACCCLVALYFGIELTNEVFACGVLGFGLFLGFGLIKGLKRKVRNLVLGLYWFGVLLCLGSRKEELRKWVEKNLVVCSSVVDTVPRRRSGRRKFW